MYLGKNILLGSGSPRRRELLSALDIPFTSVSIKDVEETYPDDLPAHEVPVYLSKLKASAYLPQIGVNDLLITADTVVIVDNEILGKPADREEAYDMLRKIAGRAHEVVTGVTLSTCDSSISFAETTKVHFAQLSDEQIYYYIDNYRPFDKAGAYGIQEWIGIEAITSISGCYYNVMGLPTARLSAELRRFIQPS